MIYYSFEDGPITDSSTVMLFVLIFVTDYSWIGIVEQWCENKAVEDCESRYLQDLWLIFSVIHELQQFQ